MEKMLEKARPFVYRSARPLDFARWQYLFENGSAEAVLDRLAAYQNADGGFGHALEADCWNPCSTPMQTWAATRIVAELAGADPRHPLIAGLLAYLASGDGFDGHRWQGLNAAPSNDRYPHAPWWACTGAPESGYNPTASLIGFMLRYAGADSPAGRLAARLLPEACAAFESRFPLDSMHEAACYAELYEALQAAGLPQAPALEALLRRQIACSITADTSRWQSEYVCRPSLFVRSRQSGLYAGCEAICRFECDFLAKTQNDDGTWNVTWQWDAYPEAWAVSKNWWKTDLILRNLAFVRAMEA